MVLLDIRSESDQPHYVSKRRPIAIGIGRGNNQQKTASASLPTGRQVCSFLCTSKEGEGYSFLQKSIAKKFFFIYFFFLIKKSNKKNQGKSDCSARFARPTHKFLDYWPDHSRRVLHSINLHSHQLFDRCRRCSC